MSGGTWKVPSLQELERMAREAYLRRAEAMLVACGAAPAMAKHLAPRVPWQLPPIELPDDKFKMTVTAP